MAAPLLAVAIPALINAYSQKQKDKADSKNFLLGKSQDMLSNIMNYYQAGVPNTAQGMASNNFLQQPLFGVNRGQ